MINTTTLCDYLNRILLDGYRALATCDGISIHAPNPVCDSDRIAQLWRDVYGEWRWHSLYLGQQLSGKGTVFDGIDAVQEATKAAAVQN